MYNNVPLLPDGLYENGGFLATVDLDKVARKIGGVALGSPSRRFALDSSCKLMIREIISSNKLPDLPLIVGVLMVSNEFVNIKVGELFTIQNFGGRGRTLYALGERSFLSQKSGKDGVRSYWVVLGDLGAVKC